MDMTGDSSGFVITNSMLARRYWYIIAGVLGLFFIVRIIDFVQTKLRLRTARSRSVQYPTKPQNFLTQSYATATAICREVILREVHYKNRWVSWLSPPPLGRSLILGVYWAVIIYMLCWESVVDDAYYYERIGFRAAWTSVTQVPLVYLLASKSSIIGFLSGSSHERLNWLHRWVSRTLLLTVTIHGAFFLTEWVNSGTIMGQSFVAFELDLMPMVKYGIGAWFVLLWTFISSLTPIRRWSYEFFVLQHLAAAAVLLWLLWSHVPAYATYNIWFAIGAVAFDRTVLFCWTWWENVHLRPSRSTSELKPKVIGHHAFLRAVDDETTEVIIKDISFKWAPGQHIYLRLPTLGPLEAHPFTIANNCVETSAPVGNDIQLIIQSQSGFTKRLHRKAATASEGQTIGMTAIVTGPFGCPPAWNSFETLVLISASTGASFIMPILESLLATTTNSCASRIDVLMIFRRRSGYYAYRPRIGDAVRSAEAVGMTLNVTIAITGESASDLAEINSHEKSESRPSLEGCQCNVDSASSSTSSAAGSIHEEKGDKGEPIVTQEKEVKRCCCGTARDTTVYTCGRPDIASFIRGPVEASGGETSVAVCGGNSLVALTRNLAAQLSDERAVHKGTGAQGIHVHAEHYCF